MSTRVTPNAAGTGHEPTSAFVMIDPATGGLVPAPTRGSGALDANTQRVTLATNGPGVASLSSIDNKTPALVSGAVPTTDSLGGTRTHNTAGGIRQAVGAGSARVALPTLSAPREMYVMAAEAAAQAPAAE